MFAPTRQLRSRRVVQPKPTKVSQPKKVLGEVTNSNAINNPGQPKQAKKKPAVPKTRSSVRLKVKEAKVEHKPKKTRVDYDDLDADDFEDPMMVSEYVHEIFEYLKELEIASMPKPDYMDNQKELQWRMRSILVDWLIEVHVKFRLLPETLYLAVNIIDRFLSQRVVSLVKLQLVGLTSLFIASKYEEVVAPSIQNFLYMAEDGYTEDEIIRAERYVLQVLKFNMQYPTPMSFLRRSSKADDYDIQTRTLAKYLMEVTLLDHQFLTVPPSLVAASAHYLARHMLNRGKWTRNLVHYSGYEEKEMSNCVEMMLEYLKKPTKYEAVYKKYSQRKFMKGAIFVNDWIESNRKTGLHPIAEHAMNSSDNEKKESENEEDEEEDEDESEDL